MSMLVNSYGLGATAATDPYFANVVLLCGFDGVNNATTFTDESASPHTLTGVGNVKLTNAQSKFGTTSAVFDGTGDRITTPDSADWDMGTGPFTVEGWYYFVGKSTNQSLIGQINDAGGSSAWFSWILGAIGMRSTVNGVSNQDVGGNAPPGTAPALGTWLHMAYDRNAAGKARVYHHGVMSDSSASVHNGTIGNSISKLVIGAIGDANVAPAFDFQGNMNEVRVTKGVARYDSDSGLTVPTAPFPRS